MKKILLVAVAMTALLASCHESLEKRAQREAREYTQKNCPTPWQNSTRTDSVVFDIPTLTYTYYCSVKDKMDDAALIDAHRRDISDGLLSDVKTNTTLKAYKDAGYSFAYVLRSAKKPGLVLYKTKITPKDYGMTIGAANK